MIRVAARAASHIFVHNTAAIEKSAKTVVALRPMSTEGGRASPTPGGEPNVPPTPAAAAGATFSPVGTAGGEPAMGDLDEEDTSPPAILTPIPRLDDLCVQAIADNFNGNARAPVPMCRAW